jgi:hypothetical protein
LILSAPSPTSFITLNSDTDALNLYFSLSPQYDDVKLRCSITSFNCS